MGIDEQEKGVVAVKVDPDSRLYEAGIRPGDIILQINQKNIATLEDYKQAVAKIKAKDRVSASHPQEERRSVRYGQAGIEASTVGLDKSLPARPGRVIHIHKFYSFHPYHKEVTQMGLILIRFLFIFLSTLLGYYVSTQLYDQVSKVEGMAIGFGVSVLIILTEFLFRRVSLKVIVGGILGFILGLMSASIIAAPLKLVPLERSIVNFILLLMNGFFGYIGIMIGIREGEKFNPVNIKKLFKGGAEENIKIMDTSVIIDGRIADVCETEFLDGTILIPQFILHELQHIADSSDSLKRARGRRGLDILHRIQKMSHMEVRITEEDFPKIRDVDSKLIALAKKIGAKVITNDFNLNKVAELQGVKVLNINDLSNAVKPVALPGESMRVFVLKEGKEPGQGVAYLDDGTMIVVENGRRFINKNVDVAVTSVLQTAAGRMIFTKLKEDMEHDLQTAER